MTDTLETHEIPVRSERHPNRLNRALAWVGIAAGSLFIVATVFFSGYVLGQHGGGPAGKHGGPQHMMLRPPPMMGPHGPMGPDGERFAPLTPPSQAPAQPATPPR